MNIPEKIQETTEYFEQKYQEKIHHLEVKRRWFSSHCGMKTLKLIPYVNEDVKKECKVHKDEKGKRLSEYICSFVEICQCEECSYRGEYVKLISY